MESNRFIFHIDINHCFAQIEEMLDPSLRDVPMCVGGDESTRSGIVLARNVKAREFGVKTAETLRDAKRKCPRLVVIPPRYKDYIYYATKVKNIFKEYSDKVESFGIDEAWIDITHSYKLFGKPYDIAKIIQKRVLEEVGLTVSVGVSWNKVFAKLGSDLIKPSGLVYITKMNYKDVVWKLPVEELLYIGYRTKAKLNNMGIHTIGDLAQTDISILRRNFGVKAHEMWNYANGKDDSPVQTVGYVEDPKSVGNGFTPPHDLNNLFETKMLLQHLCDGVASRLHDLGKKGDIIAIAPRDVALKSFTRRKKLSKPTDVSTVILDAAIQLLEEHYDFEMPLRSIAVTVSGLKNAQSIPEQINLFEQYTAEEVRQEKIDKTIDALRKRFGYHVVKRASAVLDETTENLDVKKGNVIFPGRSKDFEDIDEDVRKTSE